MYVHARADVCACGCGYVLVCGWVNVSICLRVCKGFIINSFFSYIYLVIKISYYETVNTATKYIVMFEFLVVHLMGLCTLWMS